MRLRLHNFFTSLKLIISDIKNHILEAQLLLIASSLAYTTILSIIPLLAVSFSIFHAFGGMEKLYTIIEPFILENLTEGTSEEAMQTIRKLISNAHAGAIGTGGLAALILTSMSMLSSAEKAINRVWKTTIQRTWFQRISTYWFFITLGPLALSIALGAMTSNELKLTRLIPNGFLFFTLNTIILFCIYKWVPHRKVNTWSALITSAIISGIFNIAQLCYSIYTKNVVSYSKIYGSLGAIPILLLWIYILWLILLTGAAITASLQKRVDLR
ncbi:MAG: YihY family inner membrane protein [Bdellovibrio sp.]|nr:YihY family inner membrane protein [Bdellovibrio sp.]